MDGPAWLCAAAVTASLAGIGPDDAGIGFAPDDAATIARTMRGLQVAGDRLATARAIARARVLLGAGAPASVSAASPWSSEFAARIVAAVLHAGQPVERAGLIRCFDAALLRAVAGARRIEALREPRALGALLALSSNALGRGVGPAEVDSLLLAVAFGDNAGAPEFVRSALRSARTAGLDLMSLRDAVRALASEPSAAQT